MESFITILYDSEKCSGLVVLLGHSLYPKVYLFKGENDEAFYNGKKNVKIKILIWHMSEEIVKNPVEQGFIFHAITPANYTF